MKGLLIGEDQAIADWAFKAYRLFPTQINRALGIVEDGKVKGAILFQSYNGNNVEVSYYGQNTLSSGIIRSIAHILLTDFNASRVTVVTSKRKKRLIKSLMRLGFRLEGVQRCYYGLIDTPKNTGVRFVMFREKIEEISITPSLRKKAS